MKKTLMIIAMLLTLLMLMGCASTLARPDAVELQPEQAETKAAESAQSVIPAPASTAVLLEKEEAVALALEHAGLTADDVTQLEVSYELDDGIHEYEVEFHAGTMEYEYTLNAETGELLSFEMDD